MTYQEFRTGFTFADIRQMLWSYSDDPRDWHKGVTRRTVLGKWREIKLRMWDEYKHTVESTDQEINLEEK